MNAGGGADNGRKKRSVLIVSILLPRDIDLALLSNMQMLVDVLQVCQVAIFQGVTATPITFMRDAEVEDRAPAAILVSQEVANPQGADSMSSLAEERGKGPHHPVVCLGCT